MDPPENQADLNGADVNQADLNRADLNQADLNQADLNWADVNQANLNQAEVTQAELNQADLNGADVNQAEVNQAELNQADLNGADVNQAEVTQADVNQADLNRDDVNRAAEEQQEEEEEAADEAPSSAEIVFAAVLLGAGATVITHPVIYVRLLIQVGHEPLPPSWGTTVLGRRVRCLPGLFSYARHIVAVDGRRGLFRGLSPHIVCCAVATVVKRRLKQVLSVKKKKEEEEEEASLRTLVREISQESFVHCLSRVASHPFHVLTVRCMAQFVGREVKYSGLFSGMLLIVREEGLSGLFGGLVPQMLGELLYLWGYSLLCHFINTHTDDNDTFSQASAIRSYSRFVINFSMNLLRSPFALAADLTALNDCGLAAGRPPFSPVFRSWLHCWKHLSSQGNLFRGTSLFFRRLHTKDSDL